MLLAVWLKGLVGPIVAVTTVAMINIALYNEALAAFYPWSASYLLVTGKIAKTGHPSWIAVSVIAITAVFGFLASIIYFKRQDVK